MLRTASHTFIITIILHTTISTAYAGVASFQGLGTLPGATHSNATGVSADGSTVVGSCNGQAFRWMADAGMIGLGALPSEYRIWGSTAMATSADGSVVVGVSDSGTGDSRQAFRWTAAEGMVGLGDPPSGLNFYSTANGISPDGSVIVGKSGNGEAFRWTEGEGMVELGILDLPGGPDTGSEAHSTSVSGLVVVGESNIQAFRWTTDGGMIQLPGGVLSRAYGTSVDGSVVVGESFNNDFDTMEAFRWTAVSGTLGLGTLPNSGGSSAFATSANGSVVVGQSAGAGEFIWDFENGMRSLHTILTDEYGLDLTGWQLNSATGISADGLTIVGDAINPSGKHEAWIATITIDVIPEPGSIALLCLGLPALLKRQGKLRRSRTMFRP